MKRFVLLLAAVLCATTAQATEIDEARSRPRPLSKAERAGVEIASRYLAGGPDAIWENFADASPFRRVGPEEARREVIARLGPHRDVHWQLQTVEAGASERIVAFSVTHASGVHDAIVFEMVEVDGRPMLMAIRSSGEPIELPAMIRPLSPTVRPLAEGRVTLDAALAAALPGMLLAVTAVALIRTRRWAALLLGSIAAISVATSAAIVVMTAVPVRAEPATDAVIPRFIPLGALATMREAVASGDVAKAQLLYAALPEGPARDVAILWKLQLEQREDRNGAVQREVSRLRWRRATPLAQLLLARAAFTDNDVEGTLKAYERATRIGSAHDALWLEAAMSLSVIGMEDRAAEYLRRASRMQSREPLIYYMHAVQSVMEGDQERAVQDFLGAWKMRPLSKRAALSLGLLWQVYRRPEIADRLELGRVGEVSFATPASDPMPLQSALTAEIVGDALMLRSEDAFLLVDGGAAIAPESATVVDAALWDRRERDELLSLLEDTRERVTTISAIADPQFRERLRGTGEILAAQNRWAELIDLTDALSARDERVPVELMVLRGHALSRASRESDLHELIVDLLENAAVRRRKEPTALVGVAELLVAADMRQEAIKLLDRARRSGLPSLATRITQLRIEEALASRYDVLKTPTFDIVYPPQVGRRTAEMAADILEKEYVRLQREWLPGMKLARTRVNLLYWSDFQSFTGSDFIAGLFTDEIFLPMAGVERFAPELVEIMSHELFHAMLAGATNDLAPRWFHEAFASRIEMSEMRSNAFHQYRDDRWLSIALLDDVANTSPDPDLVVSAYSIGESTIRFIEARWGRAALLRLVTSFRNGASTDVAVKSALGVSIAELDRLARAWGVAQPMYFSGSVTRYDDHGPPSFTRARVRR